MKPKRLAHAHFLFALAMVLIAAGLEASPQSASSLKERADASQQGTSSENAPTVHDGWGRLVTPPAKNQKSAPAPRHDLSGTWEAAGGTLDGAQFNGSKNYPEDGKSDREPSYTPLGRELW